MPFRRFAALAALVGALFAPLAAAADDAGVPDGGVELCTEPEGVGNDGYQSADDFDDDGLLDWEDSCPFGYDVGNYDIDEDGVGDVCDDCPAYPNPDQWDADGDGIGDACDNDADGDGVLDFSDNCGGGEADGGAGLLSVPNPGQEDLDGDGDGDACDSDLDGDGLDNGPDPCPYNAANDGTGCNADPDGDGFPTFNLKTPENEINDNCPESHNPYQEDLDGDGAGDACDPDLDGDGLDNGPDPCPYNAANDGTGCNADPDGDGFPTYNLKTPENEINDNCAETSNPYQEDLDDDGAGDACDPDLDGDGVLDTADDCPLAYDPLQEDGDRDGMGDPCDDDGFCFVVAGEMDACLDPGGPFAVIAPDELDVDTGQTVRLRLFANWVDARIAYAWSLTGGPSESGLENPAGEAACSTPYEYHYVEGEEPTFTPAKPGTYTLSVSAALIDDPDAPAATDSMALRAYGVTLTASDTCNCDLVGRDSGRGASILSLLLAAFGG